MRCIAILLFFISCSAFAAKKSNPIKIMDATKQSWVSGAPGGRSGTNYSIKVYVNTKQKLEFKNLWLGADNVLFDVSLYAQERQKKIQYGDSVQVSSNVITGEKKNPDDRKRLPLDYKGAALIECTVDGKARYFIVQEFKEIPVLHGQ